MVDHLPAITLGRHWVKHLVRLLPFVAALSVIVTHIRDDKNDQLLKGAWKVESLNRNGQALPATAWSRLYFTDRGSCTFSPHPFWFRLAESWNGDYKFDSLKNRLAAVFYQGNTPLDTLKATVSDRTGKAMRPQGIMHRYTLDMQLAWLK